MVTIPSNLLLTLAALGVIAFCCAILWVMPQLWYRLKYKRFRPSYQEIELKHVQEKQELHLKHLRDRLDAEKQKSENLSSQLQGTIDKLVNKI